MFVCKLFNRVIEKTQALEFIAPLAMRLYLAPVFWVAGMEKAQHMQSTIEWFGNAQWGLGLPFPTLMAYLAVGSEIIGSICLAFGLALRLAVIPLLITMVVAALTVHLDNGWFAISPHGSEAASRLRGFLSWLQKHYPQRHGFITELGKPVSLNNGVEFAVTYFIMLLSLYFTGAGKYISIDYWFGSWLKNKCLK